MGNPASGIVGCLRLLTSKFLKSCFPSPNMDSMNGFKFDLHGFEIKLLSGNDSFGLEIANYGNHIGMSESF